MDSNDHSHLSDIEKSEIKKILSERIKRRIEIEVLLDYENNPDFSHLTEHLLREMSELNQNIKCNFYKINEENGKKIVLDNRLYLDKTLYGPIIFYKEYPNIIHFGFPLGMEFSVFLEELEFISSKKLDTQTDINKTITEIDSEMDILVFVTSTCPYCPVMSLASHKFAFLNRKIRGIVVESEQFPTLTEKYYVYAVPKVIILKDGEIIDEFEGAIPEIQFAKDILKLSKY